MTVIPLASEYLPLVRGGRKRSTIRKGRRSIEHGPAEIVSGRERIQVTISAVRFKQLAELTEEDARRDGFGSVADLLVALRRFYPELNATSTMTIIDFDSIQS